MPMTLSQEVKYGEVFTIFYMRKKKKKNIFADAHFNKLYIIYEPSTKTRHTPKKYDPEIVPN
jgi:hypothetical protein